MNYDFLSPLFFFPFRVNVSACIRRDPSAMSCSLRHIQKYCDPGTENRNFVNFGEFITKSYFGTLLLPYMYVWFFLLTDTYD